ncbi:hypothetical protein DITRI_Ditri03aG0148000 [Diplodiscus trichospermus]
MDSDFCYFFTRHELRQLENDQIPDDYDYGADDDVSQGQYRCCHALIDRNQWDSMKLIEEMEQKLFHQLSYLPSSVRSMPEWVKYNYLQNMVEFVESFLSDERNVNQTKFLIAVTFGAVRYYDEEEDDDEDEDEDAAEETTMEVNEELSFVPASKSAIEALENVSGMSNECVICLGNIDKEAKRMPCGHVYHGDCIVEWLEKSHLCPLCRYAMPVDSCN